MSKFSHADDNDDGSDDAKAIAIPRVFSENSQAKNAKSNLFCLEQNLLIRPCKSKMRLHFLH